GQHAAVDVEAGDGGDLVVVPDEDRRPPGHQRADPVGLAPGDEHRPHRVGRLEQRPQRDDPLGHEEVAVPLDQAAAGRVVEVPVVVQRVAAGHAAILPAPAPGAQTRPRTTAPAAARAATVSTAGRSHRASSRAASRLLAASPASVPGHRAAASATCQAARAPAATSPRSDNTVPSANTAASVARSTGPAWCWNSRASGGPPIEVAVPMAPDATPAARVVARVTGRSVRTTLVATATSTATPASTDSVRAETTATTAAPTTVPGSRPAISQATADRSTPWRSRRSMPPARGRTSSISVEGRASGSTTASTGAASRLAPKPTDPWTSAPSATTTSTTTYSAGSRCRTDSTAPRLPQPGDHPRRSATSVA